MTTSGPNPWFWVQNHGFGPNVVTFGVNIPKQPKMTSSGPNPGSGPENLGLGQMWSFWVFWEGTQENMLPALPAPGRSPLNNQRLSRKRCRRKQRLQKRTAATASALRERSVTVPVAASNNVADHHV